ncbi:hypothetical protein [Apilactobacillus xinyiensis]|uniref:hypothetical protein n=1 Tax=Apilactobacillus xinyiensis TaxID=2841032 RepID=UPI001C7D1D31|nr:hypothetical protein [Apilactobacillus xinyiensis]
MLVLDVVSTSFGAIVGFTLGFIYKEAIMAKSTEIACYIQEKFNKIKGEIKL